jgi:hypothetical protein
MVPVCERQGGVIPGTIQHQLHGKSVRYNRDDAANPNILFCLQEFRLQAYCPFQYIVILPFKQNLNKDSDVSKEHFEFH